MTSTLTEADLQKQVVDWLKIALPPGCVFHHSPNEGKRHVAFKKKLKTMGTQSGWPDLEIFIPSDQAVHSISTSVFIELKRPGGKARCALAHTGILKGEGCEGITKFIDEVKACKIITNTVKAIVNSIT